MNFPPLYLKKNADRRLRAGHLWIYSNEVDVVQSPLNTFEAGQSVTIFSYNRKILGTGYANPHSLICARLMSRDSQQFLNHDLLVKRINRALSLRNRLFEKPFYRLIYGESDGLSGLVVDRFGDVVVVQINTAGMERVRTDIIAALEKILHPRAIVLRNDSSVRMLEGLETSVEVATGSLPPEVIIEENGSQFSVSVLEGQKTGWFYDHRLNRVRMCAYVKQQRVLDMFSYSGAWGIQAAMAGAKEVLCIDSSAKAIEQVHQNAALNNMTEKVKTLKQDAFESLKSLQQEKQKFDVVILDPPAFIKRKKDQKEGEQAYRRLNQMAMQLLNQDGILVSASCSLHLQRITFLDQIRRASQKANRKLHILEQGHQSPDHPVHPAISETEYIKTFISHIF